MNVLQQIFTDYYEEIEYILHPRKTEMENIDKMIHCGDPSFGGAMYGCPHCGKLKFVPFRCHSRFCPTCGNKYTMDRTTSMSFKLVNVTHRHCVFTIDENLREFFLKDRSLLDCLFHSVNSVITRMFFKMNKSKNFTPGFIMVLHTFGRDLKWNPHIHCLVCEEAFDTKKNKMKNFSFISYKKLRKTWMYQVLDLLSKQKLKHFRYLKQRFYDELVNGFYVYAKKKEKDNGDNNVDDCVNYITRYTSRPPMAENRIIKYEDDKKMIR